MNWAGENGRGNEENISGREGRGVRRKERDAGNVRIGGRRGKKGMKRMEHTRKGKKESVKTVGKKRWENLKINEGIAEGSTEIDC